MAAGEDLQRVEIAHRDELSAWLAENHGRGRSAWLVTWKKGEGARHVPYDAVVEELLAWGWVDGLPRKLDAARSMLLIAPRKPGSAWSAANRARIARLVAGGRLQPPGAAAVAAAKKDGSWSFLNDVEALVMPEDLGAALADRPPAAEQFAGFPRSVRRGILEWIKTARRPETRARRIAETAEMARRGERAHQFRR